MNHKLFAKDHQNAPIINAVIHWCIQSELLVNADYVLALTGSRSFGYATPSSDYDFEILCEPSDFARICQKMDKPAATTGIRLRESQLGIDADRAIDLTLHDWRYVENALLAWKDEPLWIWQRAVPLHDPAGWLASVQQRFSQYPAAILQRKVQAHFLRDFHLSVHGITYNQDSENKFSVLHTLGAKAAEYCRLCCLLDGHPYPYEKWLLRACYDSSAGSSIAPLLDEVIQIISNLPGPLRTHWDQVKKAVEILDEQACEILEEQMIAFGISRAWIDSSYGLIEQDIYS